MQPIPYLFFNGQCEEAMTFYADLIGDGKPELMRVAGSPMADQVAEDRQNWVLHGSVPTKNGVLMGSDDVFEQSGPMAGSSLMLNYATAAEAKLIFDALSDGGAVEMPFNATFWSAGFGSCTDRFGIKWMVGCDEQVTET